MEKKSYRPKEGVENLALTFPNAPRGEVVEISRWPYEASDPEEQRFLAAHPKVEEASAVEVEATDAAAEKASALDVDLSGLEGSGEGGRILVADVEQAAKGKEEG